MRTKPEQTRQRASDGELPRMADGADSPALLTADPRLARLTETAKNYARAARSENTARAYDSDWRQFASWLRRNGFDELPPEPQTVGLYLAAQAEAGASVATLERRLSGICWRYRQLGTPLDARDRHIATVLAGIRRKHARPPAQKAAIFADELLAMLATLEMDLRGLRDRAILALGFAGGLRRSEIVGLDCGPGQSEDGSGWIEIYPAGEDPHNDGGVLLQISGKTGWREVEIGRGSTPRNLPRRAARNLDAARSHQSRARCSGRSRARTAASRPSGSPTSMSRDSSRRCAMQAGIRGDLTEGERKRAFGGHSLRAGLASSAQIEEAHVQKHLGHASAEMTRRYQRKRDRFQGQSH